MWYGIHRQSRERNSTSFELTNVSAKIRSTEAPRFHWCLGRLRAINWLCWRFNTTVQRSTVFRVTSVELTLLSARHIFAQHAQLKMQPHWVIIVCNDSLRPRNSVRILSKRSLALGADNMLEENTCMVAAIFGAQGYPVAKHHLHSFTSMRESCCVSWIPHHKTL